MGMYFVISRIRRSYEKAGFKTYIDASSFQQTNGQKVRELGFTLME